MHTCLELVTRCSLRLVAPLAESLDTMKLAKEVLGLRESWNPHSNWGLQALSHHLLGIHVDKGSQCSNWEADELSEQQVEYAAIDVFLPWMLGMMLKTLKTKFKAKRGALAVRWNGAQAIPEMCYHPLPTPLSTLPLRHSALGLSLHSLTSRFGG